MRVIALAAIVTVTVFSGTASAQVPGTINSSALDMPAGTQENSNLDRERDFRSLRDDVFKRRPGPTNSLSPIPASPEDVTPGSDVRDKRGLLVGTVERIGKDYAVLSGPAGKVEIDFASFAKNKSGLLINLRKAQIEAMMSGLAR